MIPATTVRRIGFVLALAAAIVIVAPSAHAASGADRGFGYAWRDTADGAVHAFAGPDVPVFINPPNNSPPTRVDLSWMPGGGFPFYGGNYAQCWISDNGWLSFVDPLGNSHPTSPSAMPDGTGADPDAVIAPIWTDLDVSVADGVTYIYYGAISADNSFFVTWSAPDTVSGQRVSAEAILFPGGRIKFQYGRAVPASAVVAVGIEAAPPRIDGIQIAAAGSMQPGVAIVPNYAIEFLRGTMPSQCGSVQITPCATVNDSLPGTFPANVQYYGCSPLRFDGRERVFQFTLATPALVDLSLAGTPAMGAFLLRACNEYACIRGPITAATIPLAVGTYFVAVDTPTVLDEGPFTLNLACSPIGAPIACNSTTPGDSRTGPSLWTTYSCTGANVYDGTEAIYELVLATPTNLLVRLDSGPSTLDVFILQASSSGEISGSSCIAWGAQQAFLWNAAAGRYLIVVDSPALLGAPFDLTIACPPGVDCAPATGTIDFTGGFVQTISGDTTAASNDASFYRCDPDGSYDGGEDVYVVTVPADGKITVYATSGMQTYFLLSTCSEGSCVGTQGCSGATPITAGTYYLVVDGIAGGSYSAMIFFEAPPWSDWRVCEQPRAPTNATDTRNTSWHLNDGSYCVAQACDFAMYVSVRCGTALHMPLYDVEGGHIRVFDIMRGQYVTLTAQSTGGWFSTGTDIDWSFQDCDGNDPRWNNQTTDVHFDRPEGLCGIFRLEFPSHSGLDWWLYCNCIGDRTPAFYIYDTLCQALDEYVPLPNIILLSASAIYNCPDVTVTYTVKNDGCASATDVPVGLLDGGSLVATDVSPFLDAGETRTATFTATVGMPSGALTVEADPVELPLYPNGRITECLEVPGAGCNPLVGVEQLPLAPCAASCVVVARAVATPPSICLGQATTIDASSSSASQCLPGALEYQLRGPTGTIAWQPLPVFTGVAPIATADYDVDVRCQGDITCTNTVRVNIPVEVPPDFDPAPVVAIDVAACNVGILVSWDPATFYGTGGGGVYNVYYDTVSCAAAIAAGPDVVGLTGTSFQFVGTAGETYYFVVEAEDDTSGTRCIPPGPFNGGAVTRVEVNGGTCVGILDQVIDQTDLLPRIGGTLLAGGDSGGGVRRYGQTFVEFDWQVTPALSVLDSEHFHFLRSIQPDTGFALLTNDAPLLQTETFSDLGADHPDDATYVWHYLAFVADACDAENTVWDGGNCGPCPP